MQELLTEIGPSGTAIIISILCVAGLSLVAVLISKSLPHRPSLRHTVLLAGLISCVLCPMITTWVVARGRPLITVPLLHSGVPLGAIQPTEAALQSPVDVPDALALPPRNREIVAGSPAEIETPTGQVDTVTSPPSRSRSMWRPVSWISMLLSVWGLGSFLLGTRCVSAILAARRIVTRARPVASESTQAALSKASQEIGLTGQPNLLVSDSVRAPVVIGWLKASIVLPTYLSEAVGDRELHSILVHELAHVKRRDAWWLLLQTITCVFYWPVLSIHWLSRELTRCREEICDNYVLHTTPAIVYGQTLLTLGRLAIERPERLISVGILNWQGKLETRIAGLLDDRRSNSTVASIHSSLLVNIAFIAIATLFCGARLVAAKPEATDNTIKETASAPTADSKQGRIPDDAQTLKLRFVDSRGNAVSGAEVTLWQLAYSSGSRSPSKVFQDPVTTDAKGQAAIRYPRFVDDEDRLETKRIGIKLTHEAFADWSQYLPVEHSEAIALPEAKWVDISVVDENGAALKSEIYPMCSGIGTKWKNVDGVLELGPIDLSSDHASKMLRVVHVADDGSRRFSKLVDLQRAIGDVDRMEMTVQLQAIARVSGTLSGDVPRPVQNGKAIAMIISSGPDPWRYSDVVAINKDGTFQINGLPSEEDLQLITICDGWVSQSPKPTEVSAYSKRFDYPVQHNHGFGTGSITPQLHRIAPGVSKLDMKMLSCGSARVTVIDAENKPIAGAIVGFSPNQRFHNGGSQLLGQGRSSVDYLRMSDAEQKRSLERGRTNATARTYAAITNADGVAEVSNLPAHASYYADDDGSDRKSGQFIEFFVTREGYRLVPKEPQRIMSVGGIRVSETIDMIPGKTAEVTARMQREGVAGKNLTEIMPPERVLPIAQVSSEPPKATVKAADVKDTVISIRGTATDSAAKAVAGAKVRLIENSKVAMTTTTDAMGSYVFEHSGKGNSRSFWIYATAEGHGLSWVAQRSTSDSKRPESLVTNDQSTTFYAGEPVVMDIHFLPEASLSGRVIDEQGQPIAGVTLAVSNLDYLDTGGMVYHHNYRELSMSDAIPERLRKSTSSADGNFEIRGLPQGTVAHVRVSHDNFADQSMYVAITDRKISEYTYAKNSSHTIRNGKQVTLPVMETRSVTITPLQLTLSPVRTTTISLIDRNNKPLEGFWVSGSSGSHSVGVHASAKSDSEGKAQLKLPVGDYRLSIRPPRDSVFVPTESTLKVDDSGISEKAIAVQSGCMLVLKAVDADSGEPIAGMSFWREMEEKPGSRTGLNSTPTYVDHPKTDASGILKVIVKPGMRRIGVGWSDVPKPYLGGDGGRRIQCLEGETIEVTFECRKS